MVTADSGHGPAVYSRKPDVGVEEEVEVGRHDPDDGHREAVGVHDLADNILRTSEPLLPIVVAEDHLGNVPG